MSKLPDIHDEATYSKWKNTLAENIVNTESRVRVAIIGFKLSNQESKEALEMGVKSAKDMFYSLQQS